MGGVADQMAVRGGMNRAWGVVSDRDHRPGCVNGGWGMSKKSPFGARGAGLCLAAAAGLGLSGCAAPIIGGLTAAQVFSIAGLGATVMTGRDLTEHAVSLITGKDCRFLETLLRNGRSFCEAPNTVATRDDFHGVFALFDDKSDAPGDTPGGTKVAAADLDPALLGFAPVDRRAAEDFSLEIARKKNTTGEGSRLSFGLLSATFGQSWSYNLNLRDVADAQPAKLADAMTTGSIAAPGLRPSRGDYFGL